MPSPGTHQAARKRVDAVAMLLRPPSLRQGEALYGGVLPEMRTVQNAGRPQIPTIHLHKGVPGWSGAKVKTGSGSWIGIGTAMPIHGLRRCVGMH